MKALTNKQASSFSFGELAFTSYESSVLADSTFIDQMREVVGTKANSYERKGFEAAALAFCINHSSIGKDKKVITGSIEVKRLRAKLAKVEADSSKQNWTIKFGTDAKTGVANVAHLQRSTSAIAKKAVKASKDVAIKGVKDLDALLDYAIANYGMKATVEALTAKVKAAK